MSQTIRVGIVGCGKIARVAHVPGFQKAEGVEIRALMDANAACAQGLRESVGLESDMAMRDAEAAAYLTKGGGGRPDQLHPYARST